MGASLRFVNRERERMGLTPLKRLPRGRPGDKHGCVIQRAFADGDRFNVVGISRMRLKGKSIPLPFRTRAMILLFDLRILFWQNANIFGTNELRYKKQKPPKYKKKVKAKRVMNRQEKREMAALTAAAEEVIAQERHEAMMQRIRARDGQREADKMMAVMWAGIGYDGNDDDQDTPIDFYVSDVLGDRVA